MLYLQLVVNETKKQKRNLDSGTGWTRVWQNTAVLFYILIFSLLNAHKVLGRQGTFTVFVWNDNNLATAGTVR